MHRKLLPLAALLNLMLLVALVNTIPTVFSGLLGLGGFGAYGRVYTVAEVQGGLVHHRETWLGRTVLLQGYVATYSTWSASDQNVMRFAALVDAREPAGAAGLTLVWGHVDPRLQFLRNLPLFGSLAPRPQTLHLSGSAIYRVQLQAAPGAVCTFPACFQALLLDAVP